MKRRSSVWVVALALSVAMTASGPARAAELTVHLAAVSDALFKLPHDMTLTPDGRHLVVADMGQDRVAFLDPSTLALRHAIGQGEMSFPHDVTFDPQGRLLVADSGNDRILVYALDGLDTTLVETWDGLPGVEGLAVAPNGDVYAALVQTNQIVRLKDGRIDVEVDTALGAKLDRPHDVEIATDAIGLSLYATDPGNHRLIVFDKDIRPLYEISTWDPPFSEPKYVSVGPRGRIFVADQYNNRIRVFSAASQPLGEFALGNVKLPEGVLARDGNVWVSDTEGGRIILYRIEETR